MLQNDCIDHRIPRGAPIDFPVSHLMILLFHLFAAAQPPAKATA